ncbi:MAG: hypothetical protein UV61_C0006G0072 [Candidatus Gottesmanbacteria bacterium GW2011_GWB1_43_11]|uniref:Large ribosomal subunit protein uL29 n=1 Tax=Candidatus Gottesmanbacteria bacterium GW2011_GWB1_43_11 TaxID=1618446 RepID=A0A0G1EV12_9BACT|nr:MAG: hypothetical protein UV04_C0005G0071 [Candidatus Gottesmanbacteria bacterium GW2011_GWA2_42_16]KKS55743.1 MAG: hypothetical protein UV17_C0008G0094 [Candidatus Gottesmanbacteria bacterium GW2011_GWA1_42_26]KKS80498.1 MAG: hypothetical protein UV55_C0037G0003 [Candidatus Gottesmanbacteria bacterium GW2011_GWC1_43_10]KKS86871.1 MAG: hypothetical protein UV61_C0006G0072 [Candidatus Gottesmanbacteria bacterium GW2011_GWB1_43_11]OGG10477.1 MAG: 50S ribosomal protein L29 [Candidatus Gottesman
MKRNEIKSLKQKDLKELTKELATKTDELVKTKLEWKTKLPKNTRILRVLQDDIARIKTFLSELHFKEKTKS